MSWSAINSVWESGLKPMPRLVLLALADNADENGYCYPTMRTLENKTGMKRSSIVRNIALLESEGWLEVDRTRRNNRYRVALNGSGALPMNGSGERPVAESDQSRRATRNGSAPRQETVAERDLNPHRTLNEPSINSAPASESAQPEIEDFQLYLDPKPAAQNGSGEPSGKSFAAIAERVYAEYPRKLGKKRAIDAIVRALKKGGATENELIAKTKAFAESVRDREQKFIPHASTWFGQERWLDEIEIAATAKSQTFTDANSYGI